MNEIPVIWAVLKIDGLQLNPLRGSPLMASNTTTFQTILLWVCREFRLWNKEVQEQEVHCVVTGVAKLPIPHHRYVMTNSKYVSSNPLS